MQEKARALNRIPEGPHMALVVRPPHGLMKPLAAISQAKAQHYFLDAFRMTNDQTDWKPTVRPRPNQTGHLGPALVHSHMTMRPGRTWASSPTS